MIRLGFTASITALTAVLIARTSQSRCSAETPPPAIATELQSQAIAVLEAAMKESEQGFERIHAAEALIWTGRPEGIQEYFLEQVRTADSQRLNPIGVWRVLYRTNANHPDQQQEYLKQIVAVYADPTAKDRGTAAETLGKLKYAGADHAKMVSDPNGTAACGD